MRIVCQRRYGQPKLKKPKECNNKNYIGSVQFSFGEKYVNCKVWRYEGSIFVLHRDWFSECISIEEAESRKIIIKRKEKFTYKDNFGGIVLRNEAIISLKQPNMARSILENRFELVKEFSVLMNVEWFDLPCLHRWEDFFEEILRLLRRIDAPENLAIHKGG